MLRSDVQLQRAMEHLHCALPSRVRVTRRAAARVIWKVLLALLDLRGIAPLYVALERVERL